MLKRIAGPVMRMYPPWLEIHVRTQPGFNVKLLLCPSLTKIGRCPYILPKINVLNIMLAINTYRFTPQISAETHTGLYVKCRSQLPNLYQNCGVWTHERTQHSNFKGTCSVVLELLQEVWQTRLNASGSSFAIRFKSAKKRGVKQTIKEYTILIHRGKQQIIRRLISRIIR